MGEMFPLVTVYKLQEVKLIAGGHPLYGKCTLYNVQSNILPETLTDHRRGSGYKLSQG